MDPFTLKKIISNLVQFIPGIPILLLMCSLALPRLRLFVATIALSILALSSPPVSNAFVRTLENKYPPLAQPPTATKAIAVLGFVHIEQPARSANSILVGGAMSRLSEAARLWHLAPDSKLVVSGGNVWGSSDYTHAEAMAQAAIQLGVAEDKIVRLGDNRDTAEEAERMHALAHDGRLVVVTSATHMHRAIGLFKRQGVRAVAAPTDYLAVPAQWWRFSSYYLHNADRALHEYVGMLWYWLSQRS